MPTTPQAERQRKQIQDLIAEARELRVKLELIVVQLAAADYQDPYEIEVTPAMIKAGGQEIFDHSSLCEDGWDELAERVYRRMERVKRLGYSNHAKLAASRTPA